MSIVRVGMSESKTYGDGYEAIFGGKKKPSADAKTPAADAKMPAKSPPAPAKKPAKKGKKA